MKVWILIAAALLVGCSTLIDSPNPQVVCKSSSQLCPASSEALEVVWVFQQEISAGFDIDEKLTVNWYDRFEIPRPDGSEVVGQALSRYEVDVISWPALFHELAHVDFWRQFDDPDYNHGEPPGPWEPELEERLRTAYLEAGY